MAQLNQEGPKRVGRCPKWCNCQKRSAGLGIGLQGAQNGEIGSGSAQKIGRGTEKGRKGTDRAVRGTEKVDRGPKMARLD